MDNRYIIMIRRWLWLLALSAIIAGTTTYLLLKDQPIIYEAQAKLIIGPGIDTPDPDVNALRAGGQLMQTYAELSLTSPFLQSVIDELGLASTPLDMRKIIEVTTSQETQILTFTARQSNPERAIAIANLAAEKLVQLSPSGPDSSSSLLKDQMRVQANKLEQVISDSETKIKQLESDLQAITQVENQSVVVLQTDSYLEKQRLIIEQLSQERARLSDSLSSLTVLYETLQKTTTNQVKIIEPAMIAVPIPAYLWIKVILGAVAGIVLAGAFVFVFAYFDETIWTHEELAQATGITTFGVIAKHRRLAGSGKARLVIAELPNCAAAENYRLIGTKLLLADEENPIKTLLMSNLGEELDGEAGLIPANLALTLAKLGKRVALVDGNLHKPIITRIFDLEGKSGLTNILTDGEETVGLVSIDWSPNLFVLPNGTGSNIPPELISSTRMINLVEELKGDMDIVLINTSSMSTFAHSHILATKVDGVVLITQNGGAHRRDANHLIDALLSLKVTVIGVIFDYNRSSTSLDLVGRLVRTLGTLLRVFGKYINTIFKNQSFSRLSKSGRGPEETEAMKTVLTGDGDSANSEPTRKEQLRQEAFSIQTMKN
jgi:capsular exopolysaccharide synthesis family protein